MPRPGCPRSVPARASDPFLAPSLVEAVDLGRKSATAAAITSTSAEGSAARTACRISAVVGASTSVAASGSGTDVMPWMSVTVAPRGEGRFGDGDTHPARGAIADEPDRVDGLRRATRGDHDVPPGEVPGRLRLGDRRPEGAVGLTRTGRSPMASTTASTRLGSSASRPRPDGARGERTRRQAPRCGSRTRPASARSPGSPDARTCRRPWPAPRSPARSMPGTWR